MTRRFLFAAMAMGTMGTLAGCRSAGPYGYSAQYSPTSDEQSAQTGAREYDPVMYGREAES